MTEIELLAPAGSYDGMTAAFAAGADAVYIGGPRFGARAYADNPDEENLKRAIHYAKERERRLYLTVNTLLKDAEMEELYGYLNPLYREGLDAVLVQDIGALRLIREMFPDMAVHASTQMSVTGADGAAFLKELGVSRVVTARELSLSEIAQIHRQVDIEIESFIHGALCFCYSGQCLFSSMLGGRSGNRGRCAQPCRLPYELCENGSACGREGGQYLLSPKDLCTLDILPQILKSGVCSLKIEGRMKRPEYAAGVVRIYRKYLDWFLQHGEEGYKVRREDRRELTELYSRGGFSQGYYRQHNGPEMMSPGKSGYRIAQNETLLGELKKEYLDTEKPEKINGKLILSAQKSAILSIAGQNAQVTVCGAQPQKAVNRALTAADAEKQIRKTGGTGFAFDRLEIEMEDGLFLPLQALNELRRNAIDAFREERTRPYRRQDGLIRTPKKPEEGAPAMEKKIRLSASIEDLSLLKVLCAEPEIDAIYLDCSAFESRQAFLKTSERMVQSCRAAGKNCFYILPWIFREEALRYYEGREALDALDRYDGLLLRNYEEYPYLKKRGFAGALAADWNLYTMNAEAVSFWQTRGIAFDTAPPELSGRELKTRGCAASELIVYGRQPLMVSAQCQVKNRFGCDKKPRVLTLKDRKQKTFSVKNICSFCYNVIYNGTPLELLDQREEIYALAPYGVRLQFTTETAEAAQNVAKTYADVFCRGLQRERVYKEFTRGHFARRVE